MSKDVFEGFSPATIQFLKDLEQNNNKEWFDAHKDVYEAALLKPFKNLVLALSPAMFKIDPRFEFRPNKVMSRIYRDVRFSKDKSPYKTHMWLTFQIPVSREEWKDYPGFYLQLSGDSYTYGMGLYSAKRVVMDDFRDNIIFRAEEFRQETQQNVLDRGFIIMGEDYKRPLANDLDEYFQSWYQKKGVWVMKEKQIGKEVFSADFAKLLTDDFQSLEWLYNFFRESQPE